MRNIIYSIAALFIFTGMGLAVAQTTEIQAQAAPVSARLQAPASPTNVNNLNIDFVVLTTDGSSPQVQCQVQTPGAAGFSNFGSSATLAAGGDAGACNTASVLTTAGEYSFRLRVGPAASSVNSNTVTVTYDNTPPATPGNYSSVKNGCVYNLSFTTGGNSNGATAQIFRSQSTTFTPGNTTLVANLSVDSNQTVNYSDTPTTENCAGTTYYYAVRISDPAGNVSGFNTDTVVVAPAVTATPGNVNQVGQLPALGIGGTGDEDGDGQVLGADDGATEDDNSDSDEEGRVAGEADGDGDRGTDGAGGDTEEADDSEDDESNALLPVIIVGALVAGLAIALIVVVLRQRRD